MELPFNVSKAVTVSIQFWTATLLLFVHRMFNLQPKLSIEYDVMLFRNTALGISYQGLCQCPSTYISGGVFLSTTCYLINVIVCQWSSTLYCWHCWNGILEYSKSDTWICLIRPTSSRHNQETLSMVHSLFQSYPHQSHNKVFKYEVKWCARIYSERYGVHFLGPFITSNFNTSVDKSSHVQ